MKLFNLFLIIILNCFINVNAFEFIPNDFLISIGTTEKYFLGVNKHSLIYPKNKDYIRLKPNNAPYNVWNEFLPNKFRLRDYEELNMNIVDGYLKTSLSSTYLLLKPIIGGKDDNTTYLFVVTSISFTTCLTIEGIEKNNARITTTLCNALDPLQHIKMRRYKTNTPTNQPTFMTSGSFTPTIKPSKNPTNKQLSTPTTETPVCQCPPVYFPECICPIPFTFPPFDLPTYPPFTFPPFTLPTYPPFTLPTRLECDEQINATVELVSKTMAQINNASEILTVQFTHIYEFNIAIFVIVCLLAIFNIIALISLSQKSPQRSAAPTSIPQRRPSPVTSNVLQQPPQMPLVMNGVSLEQLEQCIDAAADAIGRCIRESRDEIREEIRLIEARRRERSSIPQPYAPQNGMVRLPNGHISVPPHNGPISFGGGSISSMENSSASSRVPANILRSSANSLEGPPLRDNVIID